MIIDYEAQSAWKGHETFLNWLIVTKRPNIFVEVGVHYGFSYFAACQSVRAHNIEAVCLGVDTWQGDEHTVYTSPPDEIYAGALAHNEANYKDFSYLIKKPSVEAANQVADRSVDILNIDGGHTYEAVKSDFMAWLPKMKKGGVVMFHDIMNTQPGVGVNRFYNEIIQIFPSFNFTHSYGLGVLTIDRYSA